MIPDSPARGRVREFGDDGWGVVTTVDGRGLPFHSTAIADGTRSIEVGVEVAYVVVPGRLGRWEATDIKRA